MAQGDTVSGISSLSGSGTTYDIRPAVGEEWIIHNIYFNKGVEIFKYDGTNLVPLRTYADFGQWDWLCFHLTNSKYIRMRTIRSGTTKLGYDGVRSK
jgi:hypothetical protein